MKSEIQKLLEGFGYDTHTAHLVTTQALQHDLTPADVAAWIEEATRSRTILNPRGFVRSRIANGDKPPRPDASGSTHLDRSHDHLEHVCPDCHTRPCVCDWDPAAESFTKFHERIIATIGGTTQ